MDWSLIAHDLQVLRSHLEMIDTFQVALTTETDPDQVAWRCQLIHECSFSARAILDKVLGELGLSDGTVRLSDIDRARAGMAAND